MIYLILLYIFFVLIIRGNKNIRSKIYHTKVLAVFMTTFFMGSVATILCLMYIGSVNGNLSNSNVLHLWLAINLFFGLGGLTVLFFEDPKGGYNEFKIGNKFK